MKWLEEPQNEAERLLREGLDLAARRTGDEITHRRVWAKVSDALEAPQPRTWFSGRLLFASATTVLLVAAGVVAYPHVRELTRGSVTDPVPLSQSTGSATESAKPEGKAGSPEESIAGAEPQAALIESERVPGKTVRTRAGERARVALGGGAEAELAENSAITWDNQQRPSVEQGIARLSVPHQPPGWRFSVTAGPYVVTVVGTKFQVHVAMNTVSVEVTEGVVEVGRGPNSTRLVAGDSWNGPLYPEEARATPAAPQERPMSPPALKPSPSAARGLQTAQSALQAGDTNKAVEILTRTAQGNGPTAENAAYELGRITRYNLNRPRQAVALWDRYRTRFPSGLLRTEADLSIVETLSQVGETRAALTEAEAFLSRHPTSERRQDVQRLADRLRAAETASAPK